MTWAAWFLLKLVGLRNWLREAATALLGVIRAHPWPSAVIALCGLLAVIWLHDSRTISGLRTANAAQGKQITDMKAASKVAEAEQKRVIAQKQRHYDDLAREKDIDHAQDLADARAAADRYIAAHRVRPRSDGSAGPANPPAQGDGPGVPQDMPADAVVVRASDVQACTDLYIYALNAHDWALKLER